jgi:hypothetical protein
MLVILQTFVAAAVTVGSNTVAETGLVSEVLTVTAQIWKSILLRHFYENIILLLIHDK